MDEWAPIGPLTRCCLARLFNRQHGEEVPRDQLHLELLQVFGARRKLWPGKILGEASVQLQLPDVQAQLGEFERYLEARAGRPQRCAFFPRGCGAADAAVAPGGGTGASAGAALAASTATTASA